jgi:lipopolysaccharide/colanic/teichoic acid biosynthesis glycosyltransferase
LGDDTARRVSAEFEGSEEGIEHDGDGSTAALGPEAKTLGTYEEFELGVEPGTPLLVREPRAKRVLDVALSSLMLVAFSPAFAAIAAAIRLEDGPPVLFKQERWGRHGRRFMALKFRSMRGAEAAIDLRPAAENDDRVTRLGRLLRATGLDELPQLINIFRGEMSFVGPRALAVGEPIALDPESTSSYELIPGFEQRLAVRPGLTGPATIYLPKDASAHLKFNSDIQYINDLSLARDLKLIGLSIWISLRGRWETRRSKL